MSIFQSTTQLSWSLPLKANAGRQPPFITTIAEAANFAEDEIRLGLADDVLWRQCFARLAATYDSPDSQLLVTEATRATQLALHGSRLLDDQAGGSPSAKDLRWAATAAVYHILATYHGDRVSLILGNGSGQLLIGGDASADLRVLSTVKFVFVLSAVEPAGEQEMRNVAEWLTTIGLGEYAQRFADEVIDLSVLCDLTEEDVKSLDLPLGI